MRKIYYRDAIREALDEEMARDPMVMREVDSLVIGYPDVFKCVAMSDIDKTYEMPKTAVSYRKPRRLSEKQRADARKRMKIINKT